MTSLWLIRFSLFCAVVDLSYANNQHSSPPRTSSVTNFLQKFIIKRKFPCSVFIVTASSENTLIEDLHWNFIQKVGSLDTSVYTINLTSSSHFLQAHKDIHKHTSYCSLVITFVSNKPPYLSEDSFQERFENLLTPRLDAITKRDEDHYVFITPEPSTTKAILLSKLSFHLRYKIALHVNTTSSTVQIYSLCIYCKTQSGGRGEVVQIPASDEVEIFSDFTRNFMGHAISIMNPTTYPAMYEMTKVNASYYRHKRGFHVTVFEVIQSKHNMSYSLLPSSGFGKIPSGTTGTLLPNGTWTGCMGDIINGRADIAMSVSPDDRRINFVDFSWAMGYTWITFCTKAPTLVHSWKSIFKAFSPLLWIVISSTTFIVGGFLILSEKLIVSKTGHHVNKPLTSGSIYLGLFGSLLSQNLQVPSIASSKLLVIVWLTTALIIGTAYTSKLTAFITSPGVSFVPKTFEELANSDYSWGASSAWRNGVGDDLMRSSTNPTMRKLYEGMQTDKTEVECTARAAESNYACFSWEVMQQYFFKTIFSDKSGNNPFTVADDTTFLVTMNYITRKKEIFRSHLNNVIKHSTNGGLVRHWINLDWDNVKQEQQRAKGNIAGNEAFSWDKETEGGPKPFTIANVQGAFLILAAGVSAGVIACLREILLNHYTSRSLNNKRSTMLK